MIQHDNSLTAEDKRLILPIYGRNIQNMVAYCTSLPDKAKRQECAESIISVMALITPMEKEREDFLQVLWDHLYIMSDFQLDIDFPYEVTTAEAYHKEIERTLDNDHQKRPRYRHYGRNIERMIAIAIREEDTEKQLRLAKEVAVQMKRDYINWNKDTVANAKIFADLYELSEGKLYLDELLFQLPDASELVETTNNIVPTQARKQNGNRKKRRK